MLSKIKLKMVLLILPPRGMWLQRCLPYLCKRENSKLLLVSCQYLKCIYLLLKIPLWAFHGINSRNLHAIAIFIEGVSF